MTKDQSTDPAEISIQEGNRLIAEFVAARIDNFPDHSSTWAIGEQGNEIWHNVDSEHWEFHTSWDWQIPVWSKVAHACHELASKPNKDVMDIQGQYLKLVERYESSIFTNNPEAGQKVIVEAIQWYNNTIK